MSIQDRYHEHKYYLSTTKFDFILIISGGSAGLYDRVEYGYLTCRCTDVIKVPVKAETPKEDQEATE